jgi:hypothetical protein
MHNASPIPRERTPLDSFGWRIDPSPCVRIGIASREPYRCRLATSHVATDPSAPGAALLVVDRARRSDTYPRPSDTYLRSSDSCFTRSERSWGRWTRRSRSCQGPSILEVRDPHHHSSPKHEFHTDVPAPMVINAYSQTGDRLNTYLGGHDRTTCDTRRCTWVIGARSSLRRRLFGSPQASRCFGGDHRGQGTEEFPQISGCDDRCPDCAVCGLSFPLICDAYPRCPSEPVPGRNSGG